jgi:hypothetical protein
VKISRHTGIGDVETHTGRPRCFWGIGSRPGHHSKHQNRPRARRNHIAASLAMFYAPMHDHVGEIPPSFDGITQKQNAHGRGRGGDGSGMGGGVLVECFLHARDPHSPSCGHFHKREGQTGWGMGKTVVVVGGGGRNKSANARMNTERQAHTHTGHRNGPGGHES